MIHNEQNISKPFYKNLELYLDVNGDGKVNFNNEMVKTNILSNEEYKSWELLRASYEGKAENKN